LPTTVRKKGGPGTGELNWLKSNIMKFIIQVIIVGLILIHTTVKGQEPVTMIAKLTESELSAVLPILKAEASSITESVDAYAAQTEGGNQLFLDIKSGKTDPLDWLKQHSKNIIVPPGAKYLSECSRAVSIRLSELLLKNDPDLKLSAVPMAIFAFGKDLPSINKNLLGENITSEDYYKLIENPYDASDPGVDKLRLFIKETELFYRNKGFSIHYSDFVPPGTLFSIYHPEDEGLIAGNMNIFDWTLLDPSYPDALKQCRSYILGPVIEINAEPKLLNNSNDSPDSGNSIDIKTRDALKNAGISEDRYALIKVSLVRARIDSENPDAIEVPEFDFVPTTEDEKELAKAIEIVKADALARKSNVPIYNKFKAELDPVLDKIQPYN
jgi:hypothetical protein